MFGGELEKLAAVRWLPVHREGQGGVGVALDQRVQEGQLSRVVFQFQGEVDCWVPRVELLQELSKLLLISTADDKHEIDVSSPEADIASHRCCLLDRVHENVCQGW